MEKLIAVILFLLHIALVVFSIVGIVIGFIYNYPGVITCCFFSLLISGGLTYYSVYCFRNGEDEHKVVRTIVEVVCGLFLIYPIVAMGEISNYKKHLDKVEIISQEYVTTGIDTSGYSYIYYVQYEARFIVHNYSASEIYYHSVFYHRSTGSRLGTLLCTLTSGSSNFDADREYTMELYYKAGSYSETSMFGQLYKHGSQYYCVNTVKYVVFSDGVTVGSYSDWNI